MHCQVLSKEDARGQILGYHILYQPNNTANGVSGNSTLMNITVSGGHTVSYNLMGLNEHKWYDFAIQAFNSKGVGPLSSFITKKTDEHSKLLVSVCYCG